ncbi:hypothetical protein MTY59_16520 [Mycobacterium senriense]|uniref:Uncharacterized protein n=1 Tax=Mycobacterium senriense TaxID=2775496 RepID=A0ABM7SN80_9MYCO|nr:hypothetical protein MTY59_16520 [Mycobacterium senriense]
MHRTEQAGLTKGSGRIGGQVDIAVDRHGDQCIPTLKFYVGNVADRHIVDPDPRILLQILHIGHLRSDGIRARTAAFGPGQTD